MLERMALPSFVDRAIRASVVGTARCGTVALWKPCENRLPGDFPRIPTGLRNPTERGISPFPRHRGRVPFGQVSRIDPNEYTNHGPHSVVGRLAVAALEQFLQVRVRQPL